MLPAVLSGDVCSLLGQVDRYAVSVLWELDPNSHEVISVWYGRTVIRSAFKLFYEAAQDVIDGVKTPREVQAAIPELQAGPDRFDTLNTEVYFILRKHNSCLGSRLERLRGMRAIPRPTAREFPA